MRHKPIFGIIAFAWAVAAPHAVANPSINNAYGIPVLLRLIGADGPCRVALAGKYGMNRKSEGKAPQEDKAKAAEVETNAEGEMPDLPINHLETHQIILGEGATNALFALRDDPHGLLGTIHVSRHSRPGQPQGVTRLEWQWHGVSMKVPAPPVVGVIDSQHLILARPKGPTAPAPGLPAPASGGVAGPATEEGKKPALGLATPVPSQPSSASSTSAAPPAWEEPQAQGRDS
jgi:hypothetical protein